jgi:IS30 family transposase
MLVKVAGKDTETVIDALIKQAGKLPQELRKSLTSDRGKELAAHKRFALATDIKVYFCDPHHPWQRGSNENTNGLLRQYFPKWMDLSPYSKPKLNAVARRFNGRPRNPWITSRRQSAFSELLHPPVESASRERWSIDHENLRKDVFFGNHRPAAGYSGLGTG